MPPSIVFACSRKTKKIHLRFNKRLTSVSPKETFIAVVVLGVYSFIQRKIDNLIIKRLTGEAKKLNLRENLRRKIWLLLKLAPMVIACSEPSLIKPTVMKIYIG